MLQCNRREKKIMNKKTQ